MKQATCEERIKEQLESRMEDLRILWPLYLEDPDAYDDDLGSLYEYGLSFEYVAPETSPGYFRYQLSWGGPSDEFRFYADKAAGRDFYVRNIGYAFLDWFDGTTTLLQGEDLALLTDIFQSFFAESGTAFQAWQQALGGTWTTEAEERFTFRATCRLR